MISVVHIERHNMIFFFFFCELSVIRCYRIRAINYAQQKPVLIITNYSKMILHLRQRNLVAQYSLS